MSAVILSDQAHTTHAFRWLLAPLLTNTKRNLSAQSPTASTLRSGTTANPIMMSPVARSFADDVLERDELIARLHTFSPLVAHWQELPHVFWVETAGEPVKGLSTAAFIRRLVTELRRAGYLPSAVWGCALRRRCSPSDSL